MKEEFQAEKEISIIEILKALLSKILYLILALILGAAAGGVFGYMTSKDVVYYGTSVQFYVNPTAEKVEGESIYATYGSYSTNVMKNVANLLESEIFAEVVLDEMMGGLEEQETEIEGVVQTVAKDPVIEGVPTVKYTDTAKKALSASYKSWIRIIANSTTFSFKYDNNIAESFFTVKMSLNRDTNSGRGEATITAIKDQIMIIVPEFIQTNMPKPSGYTGTNCFTTDLTTSISQTNTEDVMTETMKMAVIFGAITLIVAIVAVIAAYMSDKRLRDVEVITKNFNLPILGIIPAIDEKLVQNDSHKDNKKKGGKA